MSSLRLRVLPMRRPSGWWSEDNAMRTFPILISFDGKPPLVTGGGELAAVKARLLLKRAPSVDIAADEVVPEIAELVEQGLVALVASRPGIDQLRGRPLVIAATEDDGED